MWASWSELSTFRVYRWQPRRSRRTPKRSARISMRTTRVSWPPAWQPLFSAMTWKYRQVRLANPVSPRRLQGRGAYEADDWNSLLRDGGGNCLGAESQRHRQHEEYVEGGPTKASDRLRHRVGSLTGKSG